MQLLQRRQHIIHQLRHLRRRSNRCPVKVQQFDRRADRLDHLHRRHLRRVEPRRRQTPPQRRPAVPRQQHRQRRILRPEVHPPDTRRHPQHRLQILRPLPQLLPRRPPHHPRNRLRPFNPTPQPHQVIHPRIRNPSVAPPPDPSRIPPVPRNITHQIPPAAPKMRLPRPPHSAPHTPDPATPAPPPASPPPPPPRDPTTAPYRHQPAS